MATAPDSHDVLKTRMFLLVALAATWWIAHLFPHYTPMIRDRISDARQAIPSIKVNWNPSGGEPPQALYDRRKVALLVEPRVVPHNVAQVLQMIMTVPPDWRFVFIGSHESVIGLNRSFAIKHQQVVGKLDLMVLPEPWRIDSKEMVHRAMTDMRFYDEFLPGVEWILKYESDSILCSNSEVSLNDWLHWSWTGAPRTADDRFAGNGGLSLRRVSAIRRILQFQSRANDSQPEDEWFGYRLWTLPGESVASGTDDALAVEDVYMEKPMGYHIRAGGSQLRDEIWGDPDRRQKIFNYCPELAIIMDMKLKSERCDNDDGHGNLVQPEEDHKTEEAQAPKEAERADGEQEGDES